MIWSVGQLEEGIVLSQFVTPVELARMRALNNQERQVRYAVLPLAKYAAAAAITDAAVQAYYDAHKGQFMTPESVNLQYAQLTLAQVTAQITVPDVDLQDYYARTRTTTFSRRAAPRAPHPGGGDCQGGRRHRFERRLRTLRRRRGRGAISRPWPSSIPTMRVPLRRAVIWASPTAPVWTASTRHLPPQYSR